MIVGVNGEGGTTVSVGVIVSVGVFVAVSLGIGVSVKMGMSGTGEGNVAVKLGSGELFVESGIKAPLSGGVTEKMIVISGVWGRIQSRK